MFGRDFNRDLDRRVQDAVARYEAPEVATYQAKLRESMMRGDGAAVRFAQGADRSAKMWKHAITSAQTHGAPVEFTLPFAFAYRDRELGACVGFDNYGLER